MKTDKNKELMLACGSKTGRYDIEAPDQWRWILMNSPDLIERTMAWVKSKTTAYLHESPHCVDEHGKALYIPHLAADLECKEQTARNALGTLQSQGRIKFEKKRIWYCADIPQARAEIENSENTGRTKGEKKLPVQSYFFPYIVDFIKELPEKKRQVAETKLNRYIDWRREFLADGMASLRVIADKVEDTTLLEIGVPKKRLTKRRPEESKWVQLELLQEPDFVQSYEFSLHKPEKEFVDARAFRTAATSATTGDTPSPPLAVSSSSISKDAKKKPSSSSLLGDDEKPKPEYATPRDELKAIYYAKTGKYPAVALLDRIESILVAKGKNFAHYLELLGEHLGGKWDNPPGLLTHLARTGFDQQASEPQLKPKPKCPTCKCDNQRGAVLLNGAIVPCPDCSTAEWRKEMEAKLTRPALKTKGAAND